MPKRWKLCIRYLVLATSFVGVPRVRADAAPPGLEECAGKTADDDCDFGVCREQTCDRIDYEHWDRDADGGPPTISYACLLCVGNGGAMSETGAGCGGCATAAAGELGLRGASLSFALFMGMLLGRRRRRSSP